MAVEPDEHGRVAFEELWEHRERVRAVCRGIVGDGMAADDLTQDTYVRALTAGRPPDRRGPLVTWLAVVARHRAIDKLRADRRLLQVIDGEHTLAESHDADPVEQLLLKERSERVRLALAELDERVGRLLVRHLVLDVPVGRLAAEEGLSEASVRSALWRARRKFRAAVERHGPLGAIPAPQLPGVVQRLRQFGHRLESSGMSMFTGVVVHLVETTATVTAAAVLLLLASNVEGHELRTVVPTDSVSRGSLSLPRPGDRGEESLGANVRANVQLATVQPTRLGPQAPDAHFAVEAEVGEWSTQVVMENYDEGSHTHIDLIPDNPVFGGNLTVVMTCPKDVIVNLCLQMDTAAGAAAELETQ